MRPLRLLALLALLVLPGTAAAAPGDDPIVVLSPADGAALAATEDAIAITYTCPVYHSFDPVLATGGPADYGLSVATSPVLGTDGRLRQDAVVAADQGHVSNTLPEGQCVSFFGSGAAAVPGTYYVQVWRLCVICAQDYEAAPVRRVEVVVDAKPVVKPPARAYGGFPAFYGVALAGVPDGSAVRLERRVSGRWRTAGTGSASGEAAEVAATLPAGRRRLRAVVVVGGSEATGPARTVRVRRARGWTTGRRDDGRYTGALRMELRVAGEGRTVRGFGMDVAMLCPGIVPGQFTTQIGRAVVQKVRIAPDGTFAGAAVQGGDTAAEVRGKVRDGRVTGRAKLSLGVCSGDTAFAGKRR